MLKVSILKIDTFKIKIDIFKIKIEKCPKYEKNMPKLLHTRIRSIRIDNLIIKLSRPRPADFVRLTNENIRLK